MAKKHKAQGPQFRKTLPVVVTSVDETAGIVEAVVNVFGIVDSGNDIIHAGAFTKSIVERAGRIRVLDHHKTDSVLNVVGKPLQMRELRKEELPSAVVERYPEATGGLWTQTQFLMDTPEGKGVFQRIAAGAINEWSIGIDLLDYDFTKEKIADGKEKTVRNIRTARLWEYSPVTWGMNPATATTAVKEYDADGEEPARLLGEMLVGGVHGKLVGMLAGLLSQGWLNTSEYVALLGVADTVLAALRSVPEDIAGREIPLPEWMFWAGDGPDVQKAGRMLSQRNAQRIVDAVGTLNAVLTDAGVIAAAEEENADGDEDANKAGGDVPSAGSEATEGAPEAQAQAGPETDETPPTSPDGEKSHRAESDDLMASIEAQLLDITLMEVERV